MLFYYVVREISHARQRMTTTRSLSASNVLKKTSVCNELVESLANFLLDRIDINDELVQVLKPFISLGTLTQDQFKKSTQVDWNGFRLIKFCIRI